MTCQVDKEYRTGSVPKFQKDLPNTQKDLSSYRGDNKGLPSERSIKNKLKWVPFSGLCQGMPVRCSRSSVGGLLEEQRGGE